MYNATFSSVFNTDDGPWDSRAPCWKILTGWSINSQPALNLSDTCCFSWMLVNLWYLIGILPGRSKSWLMSLWNLSPVFSNSLRSLERSQLTGRWHTLFQCSRMVVRKTLVMTGLSVSFQYLIKLWRSSFWELLKKHTRHNSVTGQR